MKHVYLFSFIVGVILIFALKVQETSFIIGYLIGLTGLITGLLLFVWLNVKKPGRHL